MYDIITESVVLTKDQVKEAILDFIYKNERNITYPIESDFDKELEQIEIKYKCFRKGD